MSYGGTEDVVRAVERRRRRRRRPPSGSARRLRNLLRLAYGAIRLRLNRPENAPKSKGGCWRCRQRPARIIIIVVVGRRDCRRRKCAKWGWTTSGVRRELLGKADMEEVSYEEIIPRVDLNGGIGVWRQKHLYLKNVQTPESQLESRKE
ncbi:unnamed protein product [Heligmosomoides polygyrus]|uniref:Uncharacterized protein n=1 Tax=Heligmosomoides polygyrus TaxID=6339 RepID=A0A183FEN2_HELPZ|nr:unnamed protein product [Heligmosomoides polygyrus]